MPEDQRTPRSDPLTEILSRAPAEVLGLIPGSSNGAVLLALDGGSLAIYKPVRFERPLRDFSRGLHRRELASFLLARELGMDMVPPVVIRTDLPFGDGSVQLFIESERPRHYFEMLEDRELHAQLAMIAAFDLVANNADRKAGHLIASDDGRIWAIDNALTFSAHPKLRTVIWEFGDTPLPEELKDRLTALSSGVSPDIAALLQGAEVAALASRAAWLARAGRLPLVEMEQRSYPWPLV